MTVWSFTHPVKKLAAIFDADISKFIFGEKKGKKAPVYTCYTNTAKNLLKYTTKQLLQTPIFRYNNVVHCNAVSSLHCITDTSLHQRHLITQDNP